MDTPASSHSSGPCHGVLFRASIFRTNPSVHRYLPAAGGSGISSHHILVIICLPMRPARRVFIVSEAYPITGGVFCLYNVFRGGLPVSAISSGLNVRATLARFPGGCHVCAIQAAVALLPSWFRSVIKTVRTYGSGVSNLCSIGSGGERFYEVKPAETAKKRGKMVSEYAFFTLVSNFFGGAEGGASQGDPEQHSPYWR